MGSLVLSRRLDEAIMIADEVEVRVVDIKPNAIRLKITAPRSIPVHRREIYEAIRSAPRPFQGVGPDASERSTSGANLGSLVLTRHAGEEIMIGEEVKIEVREIRSQAISLRITAPRLISVHRSEIYEVIRRDRVNRPVKG
ncbi:carbon storage regulator [Tundrisphaera lichenicola]|uniref:carbon storage regulator n=1 Tax=Tundrisphaera lichenicola TaxID=2029860 RepID=UPI003EC0AC34